MYYGRPADQGSEKPKKGVHYFMFEEAMRQCLESHMNVFKKETDKIISNFRKELTSALKEVKEIKLKYGWIVKEFEKDEIKNLARVSKKPDDKDITL